MDAPPRTTKGESAARVKKSTPADDRVRAVMDRKYVS